ncbi:MAG: restriction endonuclease, partial [Desulfobulbaceae bacterium]
KRSWDRVGLSYHYISVKNRDNHLNILTRNPDNLAILKSYDISALLTHYFKTLIGAVELIPANTLCHLDAGFRHVEGVALDAEHRELIEQLLETVKNHSMSLEINTSGIRNRGIPYPEESIIRLALSHGIPLVAGSDAHRPEDVGRDFDRLEALLS